MRVHSRMTLGGAFHLSDKVCLWRCSHLMSENFLGGLTSAGNILQARQRKPSGHRWGDAGRIAHRWACSGEELWAPSLVWQGALLGYSVQALTCPPVFWVRVSWDYRCAIAPGFGNSLLDAKHCEFYLLGDGQFYLNNILGLCSGVQLSSLGTVPSFGDFSARTGQPLISESRRSRQAT
jgi:hypothetical protein